MSVEDEIEAIIQRLKRGDTREAEFIALLERVIAGRPDWPQYVCVSDYDPVLRWHCRLCSTDKRDLV